MWSVCLLPDSFFPDQKKTTTLIDLLHSVAKLFRGAICLPILVGLSISVRKRGKEEKGKRRKRKKGKRRKEEKEKRRKEEKGEKEKRRK